MKTREEIIASCPVGADLDSYLHGYANGYTDAEQELSPEKTDNDNSKDFGPN